MLVVNQLSGFGSRRRVSGGAGYSFNMTAGDFSGVVQGYDDGFFFDVYGSIDAQPVPGHTLRCFISGGGEGYMYFDGDATGLFAGLGVYVGGVLYPHDSHGFDGSRTYFEWTVAPPPIVNGNSYFVEIK